MDSHCYQLISLSIYQYNAPKSRFPIEICWPNTLPLSRSSNPIQCQKHRVLVLKSHLLSSKNTLENMYISIRKQFAFFSFPSRGRPFYFTPVSLAPSRFRVLSRWAERGWNKLKRRGGKTEIWGSETWLHARVYVFCTRNMVLDVGEEKQKDAFWSPGILEHRTQTKKPNNKFLEFGIDLLQKRLKTINFELI